ncbi:MAG: hypothetical protein M1820_009390 [Bogoriella megaspora]|nr:MAG: hypothetical protein M1820_009390 [Bogoriella megaspora]
MSNRIPTTGNRSTLDQSLETFLKDRPTLHLGGDVDFHQERRHHLEIFGFHALPEDKRAEVGKVEFEGVRGPHGSIPVRLFYPKEVVQKSRKNAAALVYMHGGGYTVGSVDEFENGLRLIAEAFGAIFSIKWTAVIGVEYRLAPEHHFPTQLDDISSDLVFGGGDSAGGNMTEAITLRRRDEGKKNILRIPFDTKAAEENNSGLYLECNGIFSFADHYLPKAPGKTYPPSYKYVSPGMQSVEYLREQPPVALFTCGFDPLRDVGVEYGSKLQEAGVDIQWHHYPSLTHGFLQFAPWSKECMKASMDVAKESKRLAYEK